MEYSSIRSRKSSWVARCISMSMNLPSAVLAWMSNRLFFSLPARLRILIAGFRCPTDLIRFSPSRWRTAFRKCIRFVLFLNIFLNTGSYVGSKNLCFRISSTFSRISCLLNRLIPLMMQESCQKKGGEFARKTTSPKLGYR